MKKQPPKEAIKEALKYPNGWIYEIDKAFQGKENVPPDAVIGAWKVNSEGKIEGKFIPNPDYKIQDTP